MNAPDLGLIVLDSIESQSQIIQNKDVKKSNLIFQLLLTLFILAFIRENFLKVAFLLPVWWMAFGGLKKNEIISFFLINFIFVVSDIGAIQNSFFKFSHPDVWGLPYWEFIMWGFYLLHTHRMFPAKVPKTLDLKLLILAIIFSQLFGIISDRNILLASTSGVLLFTLSFYHRKDDLLYCGYLMLMGIAVEFVGLRFDLWSYPQKDYNSALLQFVVMWGAAGIYFRHIAGGWLVAQKKLISVHKDFHEALPAEVQKDFQQALESLKEKKLNVAAVHFSNIEALSKKKSFQLNYDFYIQYSSLCIADGNLRKAAELSRDALPFTIHAFERAYLYLQLCRIYRMMILMKNARLELRRAFAEMGMQFPRDSALQALQVLMWYFFEGFKKINTESNLLPRQSLQIQVALYEEAGLSAYYFLESRMLIQCGLKSRRPAFQLGESIQMVNWLGGSGCVLAVLGWKSMASEMIARALKVGRKSQAPYALQKAQLWNALFLSYKACLKESAIEFESALKVKPSQLSPFDIRLAVTTLSCNYLVRGHMKASENCIQEVTSKEQPRGRYFSCGRAFVDWYRLPALGFLGECDEAEVVLKNSQIVFHRIDEEKWQITQFLGGLLTYYYSQSERNLSKIQECLQRFEALRLTPKKTYVEAAQIWIAKAHLYVDLALEEKISQREAKRAVHQLKQVPKNRVFYSHWLIAKAKLGLVDGTLNTKTADQLCEKARVLAIAEENLWVEYEVLKYKLLKQRNNSDSQNAKKQIQDFCIQHGWKRMLK